jgi:hypothetical protein
MKLVCPSVGKPPFSISLSSWTMMFLAALLVVVLALEKGIPWVCFCMCWSCKRVPLHVLSVPGMPGTYFVCH